MTATYSWTEDRDYIRVGEEESGRHMSQDSIHPPGVRMVFQWFVFCNEAFKTQEKDTITLDGDTSARQNILTLHLLRVPMAQEKLA